MANTGKAVLFLPPSDTYARNFPYLLYTLAKLYYTKALSDQASSLAPDWILLLQRSRILASFRGSATTFQNDALTDLLNKSRYYLYFGIDILFGISRYLMGLPQWLRSKEPTCKAGVTGDVGSIPGSGRFPGTGMATHSSILSWRISQTEEPGGLQSTGLQRVGHDWSNLATTSKGILYA